MPDPRPTPAFAHDLAETLAHAWASLSRGVADRRSAFHTIGVATIGRDGRPRLRTVVLRAVEPSAARLRFHTDARADKIAELAADPRIALHGYDPGGKLQIRVEGRAVVHVGDVVADAAWAASRPMSRDCYGTRPAPGTPVSAPDAFALPADEAERAAGRPNFRAVIVAVETIETLYLARSGHRRARFDIRTGEAVWLVP